MHARVVCTWGGKGVLFRVREIAMFIVVLMNYSSG